MRLTAALLFTVLLFPVSAFEQEIRYIDASGFDHSSDRNSPVSKVEGLSCVNKGSDSLRARVSFDWIETTQIHPREHLGIQFRVENVGTSPFSLPVDPSLSDLQQVTPSIQVEYYNLTLPLNAGVPGGGMLLGRVELYGSPQLPDTFLLLRPGEWIRVKGELTVNRWSTQRTAVTLFTDFWLFRVAFPPQSSHNKAATEQQCILGLRDSMPGELCADSRCTGVLQVPILNHATVPTVDVELPDSIPLVSWR